MYQVEHIRCSGCKGNGVRMGAGMMEHTCLECNGKKYIVKEKEAAKPAVKPQPVVEKPKIVEPTPVPPPLPKELQGDPLPPIDENTKFCYVDAVTGEDIPPEVVEAEKAAEEEQELIKQAKEKAFKRQQKRS